MANLVTSVNTDVAPGNVVPLLEHFHSQRRTNRVFFDFMRCVHCGPGCL